MVFAVAGACAPADSRHIGADLYGRCWGDEKKIYTAALKRTLSRDKGKDVEWRKDDRYGRMGVKMVSAARIDGGKPAFQAGGLCNNSACREMRDRLTEISYEVMVRYNDGRYGVVETRYGADLRVGDRVKVIQNKIELDFSPSPQPSPP